MSVSTAPSPGAARRWHRSPVPPLLAQAVRDRLLLVATVGLLMVGLGLLTGALWPSLQATLADLQDALPAAFSTVLAGADMSTADGWATAEVLSLMAPAAVIAVAVVSAVKGTVGEEETGTLGVLLGAPVSRSAFVAAKAAAMVVHVVLVAVAVGVGLAVGSVVGGMGLRGSHVVGASLHVAALGLLFGALALAVGAWTGSGRRTTAVTAGLGVLSFAGAAFLPLSDSLAGGARTSPWYYYGSSDPLAGGADLPHLAVLLALAALASAVATALFRRRDLRG